MIWYQSLLLILLNFVGHRDNAYTHNTGPVLPNTLYFCCIHKDGEYLSNILKNTLLLGS